MRQAHALLGKVERFLQGCVYLLVLITPPITLDLPSADVPPVLLGMSPACDALAPGLDLHDLLVDGAVLPLRQTPPDVGLDLRCCDKLPPPLQIQAGLLQTEDRLDVPREQPDRLVHLHLRLSAPARLDQRGALDEELQPCALKALVGRQFEEDHRLTNRPAQAMHWLRDAQLLSEVVQQLLCSQLQVVNMLQAGDHLRAAQDLVVIPALLVVDTHGVACSADLHNLQDAAVA
mmetsp:Transcript_15145/g.38443  ORF Transcript_15145/g.38443 Transcript_15145/m.38443 type:complete len:233 (-) Transcript_15145:2293-2991(-)